LQLLQLPLSEAEASRSAAVGALVAALAISKLVGAALERKVSGGLL